MALSAHEIQPCPALVEQWIGLLACWADSFFARQRKLALLNHLRRYLDFIILRIGLHEGSVHIDRLLTLCAFAIAYANQGQTFTVDSLALLPPPLTGTNLQHVSCAKQKVFQPGVS